MENSNKKHPKLDVVSKVEEPATASNLEIKAVEDSELHPVLVKLIEIGKAQKLSDGADVSIFACGHMVWKAIEAGRILEAKGIGVELINVHTIKPLDTEAILASISKTKCAVTVEEHNVIGGLGDAIAQVAAKNCPIPIEYIGTNDTFGESGKPTELLTKYGLDTAFIVAAVEGLVVWYCKFL